MCRRCSRAYVCGDINNTSVYMCACARAIIYIFVSVLFLAFSVSVFLVFRTVD